MSLIRISRIYPVPDIKKTAEFYVSNLEFKAIEYLECKESRICLYRDKIEFFLQLGRYGQIFSNRDM